MRDKFKDIKTTYILSIVKRLQEYRIKNKIFCMYFIQFLHIFLSKQKHYLIFRYSRHIFQEILTCAFETLLEMNKIMAPSNKKFIVYLVEMLNSWKLIVLESYSLTFLYQKCFSQFLILSTRDISKEVFQRNLMNVTSFR